MAWRLPGKREEENRTFSGFRLDPNAAPVALADLMTDRQTYSAAGKLVASVEAFTETKYLPVVPLIDSNSVVRNKALTHGRGGTAK
jgi:hypothetical protein